MEIKHFFSLPTEKAPSLSEVPWFWVTKIRQPNRRKKVIFATGMVFILTVLFAVVKLSDQVESKVKAMPCFQIDQSNLGANLLPANLLPYTQEIVPVDFPGNATIFAPDLAQRIAVAYLRNPWVEKVQEVSKKYPNRISVRLLLRRPLAWVESDGRYFLSDARARRLPELDFASSQEAYPLPLILGVTDEVPEVGQRWQSPLLQAAVEVLACLAKNRVEERLPIGEVWVKKMSPWQKEQVLLIPADFEVPIVWGSAVEEEFPKVFCDERILALQECGRLLKAQGKAEIKRISQMDIRFGYVIIQRRDEPWQATRPTRRA